MNEEMSDFEIKQAGEACGIVKNVVVMSVAFMVHSTASLGCCYLGKLLFEDCGHLRKWPFEEYDHLSQWPFKGSGRSDNWSFKAVESLQSSINFEAGIGTASLATAYAGVIVSSIFLPGVVIKWIGTKWAMCLSFLTSMPFFAAQLYPKFYTLIPGAVVVGLGAGVLWCASCTYISIVSKAHSKISNIPADALLVRFLGLFFMLYQSSQIWGNLMSSFVLSSGDNKAAVTSINATMVPSVCGASYLPSADDAAALQAQPPDKIQMLVGVYLACVLVAVLIIAVGVDSTERYESNDCPSTGTGLTGLALLSATLKLLKEPNQLLLITICVYQGMEQAFFLADFTVAFVSCVIGTGTIGFVMIAFGVADALGSAFTGYLDKRTGRLPLICSALVVHSGLFVTLLVWRPHADARSSYVLYTVAVLWGLCDSVWMVQINAYHGILFPGREEAAFCNFRLWDSFGFIVAYSMSPYLRTSAKTYVLIATMLVGCAGYFTVEYRERGAKKKIEVKNKELCFTEGCKNMAFENSYL